MTTLKLKTLLKLLIMFMFHKPNSCNYLNYIKLNAYTFFKKHVLVNLKFNHLVLSL